MYATILSRPSVAVLHIHLRSTVQGRSDLTPKVLQKVMSHLLIISADPSPVSQTRIASLLKRPLSIKCPRSLDATTTSESAAWKASDTKKPRSVLNITERQRTQKTTNTRSHVWTDQNRSCCPCLNITLKGHNFDSIICPSSKKVVLQCISTKLFKICPNHTKSYFNALQNLQNVSACAKDVQNQTKTTSE